MFPTLIGKVCSPVNATPSLSRIVAALVTSLAAWNQLAADREIETIKSAWECRKVPGASFPDPGPEIGRRP